MTDKPHAEGTVGIISTWIIASLRQHKFFSIRELNSAILLKLEEFNQKPFQKKPGSRKSAFIEEEKVSWALAYRPRIFYRHKIFIIPGWKNVP